MTVTTPPTRPPGSLLQYDVPRPSWIELLGRIRLASIPHEARRGRPPHLVKAVALRAAGYAQPDGSHVHPGTARLAVELEVEHQVAEDCLAVLLDLRLLRLVRHGDDDIRADEYHLTMPADIGESTAVPVWSPDQLAAAIRHSATQLE